jgi:hypothetical protein
MIFVGKGIETWVVYYRPYLQESKRRLIFKRQESYTRLLLRHFQERDLSIEVSDLHAFLPMFQALARFVFTHYGSHGRVLAGHEFVATRGLQRAPTDSKKVLQTMCIIQQPPMMTDQAYLKEPWQHYVGNVGREVARAHSVVAHA